MTAFREVGAGEFHGRTTRRFEASGLWFEVLAQGGPRILRLGLAGGENVFAELPEAGWDTPDGPYHLLGGHRVWYAPETLAPSVPDDDGLSVETSGEAIRLVGRLEASGLRRSMEIRPGDADGELIVRNEIANDGSGSCEIAVWPITAMRTGGLALIPQPLRRQEHAIVPNRPVVLWPYSSWEDARLTVADGVIAIEATPAPAIKVGCLSHAGVLAYLRDGLLFVKRFEPLADLPHVDYGCNAEVYSDQYNVEIESLGPRSTLAPGSSAAQTEVWKLITSEHEAPAVLDADSLRTLVGRLNLA